RARALESAPSGRRGAAGGRRRPRRLDARALDHVDAHPRQPAARARRGAAGRGAAGSRLRSLARAEHALELVGRRALELIVATVARTFVGAPAQEVGGVPEARALHVVVGDLADALRAQRQPAQVLAAIPPTRRARHALPARVVRLGPIAPRVM